MVRFKMDALRSFRYAMVRQVNEGARVRITKADICMNSKSEFHQPGIVRVVAVRGNVNEEQSVMFPRDGRGGRVRGRGEGRGGDSRGRRGGRGSARQASSRTRGQ